MSSISTGSRGDMDHVDLKAGDQLIQRTEVYPFQFRYTPPASAVGSVVKLTAEAVDKAGNTSSRDLYVNVLAADSPPASPTPVAPPTLLGTPVVGQTLGCISGGFLNQPKQLTYAWLRNGAVVAGATGASYTLTAADLGRTIACRITATNDAGSGDATSEALYVVNPAPAFAPQAAPLALAAPVRPAAVKKATTATRYKATCKRSKSRKAISCYVSANSKQLRFKGTIRLQNTRRATASRASKHGRLHLTVRAKHKLKRGQKVVLTIRAGKATKRLVARTR